MYSIYLIKNLINGKLYVGQTCLSIRKRFTLHKSDKKGFCVKLFRAMNKYGRDKFSIELLATCEDQEIANYLEISFIQKFDTIATGYNIREGGSKGKPSLETRKKMSLARKEYRHSQETIDKMSSSQIGDKNHMYGKKHTIDARQKMSESRKGIQNHTKLDWETVGKIREEFVIVQNYTKLGIKYGVTLNSIKNIILNKSWKI